MRTANVVAVICLLVMATIAGLFAPQTTAAGGALNLVSDMAGRDILESFRSSDGYFIENRGQVNEMIHYYSIGSPSVAFTDDGVMFAVSKATPGQVSEHDVRNGALNRQPRSANARVMTTTSSYLVRFEGANSVMPFGKAESPSKSNFFIGNDPARWRTGVRSYGEIVYENLYDGIDLVYHIGPRGLKYDFLVDPGADLARIRMTYEGIESLEVNPDSLVVRTAAGEVRDEGLAANSGGDPVLCEFARVGSWTAGIDCGGWDSGRALVIDPLLWATYLGGSDFDDIYAIALDSSGNIVVTGETASADFPATPGANDTTYESGDAIVAKLSADGSSLLWATFLGGRGYDGANALVLHPSDDVIVTGITMSQDFPVSRFAYDRVLSASDAFVARLSSDGSSLMWATFLGGGSDEMPSAVDMDVFGNPVVAGRTYSANFPVTPGAYDVTYDGLWDAFVAKLSANVTVLLWATFLGGSQLDEIRALTLDSAGNPVVTGKTASADFPATPGAYDVTFNNGDAVVAKLSMDGSSLLWASFLGGSNGDMAYAITLDALGAPVVVGETESMDFPVTSGAYDVVFGGVYDAFAAKLNANGSSLAWATYLGGGDWDWANAVAFGSSGDLVIVGVTFSADFPITPGAYDPTYNDRDAFIAKLSADGSSLLWASFLGGGDWEMGNAIALDSSGDAFVAGTTWSIDFPATPGAYDLTLGGVRDAFVAKLQLLSAPTMTIASPSGGEMWIQDSSHSIIWTAFDNEDAPSALLVWINYSSGAGSGSICGSVAGDVGSCDWTLPHITASDVVVNGTVIDTGGLRGLDESGPFTIQSPPNSPPMIAITNPIGGEVFHWGDSIPISWMASDAEDVPSALLVWLNYTSSAGSGSICSPVPGCYQSYAWTAPAITATDVVINGTVMDTGGLKGYGESGPFTIEAPPVNTPPTATITSPVGGEEWLKDSSHTIKWTMHDNEDANANLAVYINYTTGGGTHQVAAALKGATSFTWTLPDIEANDVIVNITVIDTGGLKNWSQSGPFTIKAPPSPPPDLLSQYWWLIVVMVIVVAVLFILFLLIRKKRRGDETPEAPQQELHIR